MYLKTIDILLERFEALNEAFIIIIQLWSFDFFMILYKSLECVWLYVFMEIYGIFFCLYIFHDEEISKKQWFKKQFYSDNLGLKMVRLFVKSL